MALARIYDVISPRAKGTPTATATDVPVRLEALKDRSEPGRELAGHVSYGLLVSRDGGRSYTLLASGRHGLPQGRADPRHGGQRVRGDRLRQQRQLRRQAARRASAGVRPRGSPSG